MDAATVASRILDLQARSILVIGDVMLDRFVDGKVNRLSPEAPVPVLELAQESVMPGGAANVACNLAGLGCDVRLLSVSGNDPAGRKLAQLLGTNLSVDFHQIIDTDRPTTTKTRFRADGQQVLRVDEEVTSPVGHTTAEQLLTTFRDAVQSVELVVLSDYAKGAVAPDIVRQVIDIARKAGKPVVTDPKLADFSIYAGSTMLTPNLGELQNAAGLTSESLEDVAEAAATLARHHDIKSILVTLSARGMLLVNEDGSWTHDPAKTLEVFDVAGAGDTVIAMIGAALAGGMADAEAVRLANIAAGVVVAKSGTAAACPGEIIAMGGAIPPRLEQHQIAALCEDWRKDGHRIGFANGCFDLLHPGHIHLLKTAASACDRLVVGLNSDASVRRLKGEMRPVQDEDQRAAVLSQLTFVDGVAVFGQDTPLELITVLQPDLIFKGGDYTAETVVGAEIAAARGGDVVIVPTLGSHSSS
ncbi:MAG: bifunctional heptose 7-phosphate kinase/heptose 1-phosphate adenyltransferase, partial [Pseudomonadota bacterium]|nr:bifunctional heptose 7-phosphate kinase/heptose 1-phosphate adenyltransferase [Pseudomonadota bacterium]